MMFKTYVCFDNNKINKKYECLYKPLYPLAHTSIAQTDDKHVLNLNASNKY